MVNIMFLNYSRNLIKIVNLNFFDVNVINSRLVSLIRPVLRQMFLIPCIMLPLLLMVPFPRDTYLEGFISLRLKCSLRGVA
jgi:hypothetical protein